MALLTLHLCQFQFANADIRRVGATIDGGTSLSGISDTIGTDGGGYWRGDWTNGSTRDAAGGLAWRGVSDFFADGGAANVLLCEKLFAPNTGAKHIPRPGGPFTDGSEYEVTGHFSASAAALRATSFTITAGTYAQPIQAGMPFSINHSVWGWRTYRLRSIADDGTATFRPPLRQAITAGTELDFDYPRCVMKLAPGTDVSNPTNLGRFGTVTLALVEDMRLPAP